MFDKKFFLLILVCSLFIISVVPTLINNSTKHKEQIFAGQDDLLSCDTNSYTGEVNTFDKFAYFEGRKFSYPSYLLDYLAGENSNISNVMGMSSDSKWVQVDLSEQTLIAWEGDKKVLETKISSGLPRTPTPKGEFRVWIKLRAAKMEGGSGRNYYYLPNVPYIMYFANENVPARKGYGLHGAYWHNDFGRPRSHGCVNLPIPVAKQLYEWIDPVLPPGKNVARATKENPGTRIVIHD
ncbi:MAG: L,D-transpeptidase [Patescibacteria group bacterium]|nr:L,D-transpeptidase [Patescibacteria group bacterium]